MKSELIDELIDKYANNDKVIFVHDTFQCKYYIDQRLKTVSYIRDIPPVVLYKTARAYITNQGTTALYDESSQNQTKELTPYEKLIADDVYKEEIVFSNPIYNFSYIDFALENYDNILIQYKDSSTSEISIGVVKYKDINSLKFIYDNNKYASVKFYGLVDHNLYLGFINVYDHEDIIFPYIGNEALDNNLHLEDVFTSFKEAINNKITLKLEDFTKLKNNANS